MRCIKWSLPLVALLFTFSSCADYLDDFDGDTYEIPGNETPVEQNSDDDYVAENTSLTLYKIQNDEITKLQDFDVDENLKDYQADYNTHQKIWTYFSQLIPAENRSRITQLEIFFGNHKAEGFASTVTPGDLSKWRLAVAIESVENLEEINLSSDFTHNMIHEFAHVLTLNESQVDYTAANCYNLPLFQGCSKDNAYITALYEIGWEDIYEEHQEIESGNATAVRNFYNKYKDRFVSSYAAFSPAEDMAEVFSHFVTLDNRPAGNSIADRKIKMLYEFPELVELRQAIRDNSSGRFMEPGSWDEDGK